MNNKDLYESLLDKDKESLFELFQERLERKIYQIYNSLEDELIMKSSSTNKKDAICLKS